MSEKNEGIIVILSSPSGAGKTTLVKEISKKKNFKISISHTTRKPRSNEINGKDYFFIGEKEFKDLINKDKFLEYAKVFNHYYGSSKDAVLKKLRNGENVIFDIDWQGTQQIKSKNIKYKIITFFVLPPSKKVLHERLSNRDMKDKLIVSERMKNFYTDIKHWEEYDFVVVNDDLEKCFKQINNLIDDYLSRKKNIDYDKEFVENHVKKLIN